MRIGNLFERDGNILEVVRISKGGIINYEIVEKNKGQHVNGGVVRPIPLTEGWLIRLGFELFNYNYYDSDEDSDGNLTTSYKIQPEGMKFEYRVDITKNEIYSDFLLKLRWLKDEILLSKFQHVHQLQNLYFALTNTELECTSK